MNYMLSPANIRHCSVICKVCVRKLRGFISRTARSHFPYRAVSSPELRGLVFQTARFHLKNRAVSSQKLRGFISKTARFHFPNRAVSFPIPWSTSPHGAEILRNPPVVAGPGECGFALHGQGFAASAFSSASIRRAVLPSRGCRASGAICARGSSTNRRRCIRGWGMVRRSVAIVRPP